MNEKSKQVSSTTMKPCPQIYYAEDSNETVQQIYIQVIQPKKSRKNLGKEGVPPFQNAF